MKKLIFIKALLLLIIPIMLVAYPTPTATRVADQTFELVPGGDPEDPLDWVVIIIVPCPGTGRICAMIIFDSDIYTLAEATAAGNPAWAGLPKVNQPSSGLAADMAAALASPNDPYIAPSGRIIYKRS
ncbi:hypothetical protein [Chitinophaga cymbidii]|uniref:Uncharacterized protein n=1 Tax=Chitinophaga cymbidii TaxID=1096750 RepID=A0A512RQ18_9BACT|nr:hypothetical protein [Chitinophaga cymbidii]GEP97777.1 hypothetical protein CCY01nite_40370 [Chitinophaga cymbidii]